MNTDTINMVMPEFSISLKTKGKSSEAFITKCGEDTAKLARFCFDSDKIEWVESFIVIGLNRANKVLGFYKVSSGGVTGTVADPKVIYQFALLSNASSIIIAHNHPSGNTTPSEQDRTLTNKIKEAGKMLDITLVDHVIVTVDGFYSFAENGDLW
jgi:DNA repair protein RadC